MGVVRKDALCLCFFCDSRGFLLVKDVDTRFCVCYDDGASITKHMKGVS